MRFSFGRLVHLETEISQVRMGNCHFYVCIIQLSDNLHCPLQLPFRLFQTSRFAVQKTQIIMK